MDPTVPVGDKTRVVVVLPCYNEEGRLPLLLDRIKKAMEEHGHAYEIIAVDDGSTDGTVEVLTEQARGIPIAMYRHHHNEGLGPTIRDGLMAAAASARTQDVIVTMDADDTHPPDVIPGMLAELDKGYDVVIASRYQPGARVVGVPAGRRMFSSVASLLFHLVFPIQGVKDYTCGFRAYRASVVKRALDVYGKGFVEQQGFHCMVDILLRLRKLGVRFTELPFVLRYDFKEGPSKMKIARTIWSTLVLMVRRRFFDSL